MQKGLAIWTELGARRQALSILAVAAMLAALFALGRLAMTPAMTLLYAGLEPAAAGEVIRALEQRGVHYEVRGESIWVDEKTRDELRLSLAGEGLPATGGGGYELLDSLSGFGTTAQMFDAAWLRAKEGELARTIAASPQIRSARVHLAIPATRPFRRDLQPSASVTVTTLAGGLAPQQAQALRHLVASAVAGLDPAQVAVIDSAGGLIEQTATGPARAETRVEETRRAVERLLAARVGQGRALVEVSIELLTDQESVKERRIEPDSRVVISTDSESRSSQASGSAPGVTVASNLPEGDAQSSDGPRSQEAQSRERINYEVSETAREVVRGPGGVRRQTVAVLVDGLRAPDGTWSPRSDEELADLRDLVASAVGYDEARGDVITLKSMEFEPLPLGEPGVLPGMLAALDVMTLIQMAIIAVVALALGLFVIRPLLKGPDRVSGPLALPAADSPALTGEVQSDEALSEVGGALLRVGHDPEGSATAPPDPVDRLRQLIAERQAESVEILRSWMDEREESH